MLKINLFYFKKYIQRGFSPNILRISIEHHWWLPGSKAAETRRHSKGSVVLAPLPLPTSTLPSTLLAWPRVNFLLSHGMSGLMLSNPIEDSPISSISWISINLMLFYCKKWLLISFRSYKNNHGWKGMTVQMTFRAIQLILMEYLLSVRKAYNVNFVLSLYLRIWDANY